MRTARRHLFNVSVALCALLSLIAFASSAAPPFTSKPEKGLLVTPVLQVELVDAVAPDAAALVTPVVPGFNPDDPLNSLITKGSVLASQGNFLGLGLLVLFGLVFLFRALVGKLPDGKFKDALLSRWGGWGLNLAVAESGCFAALAMNGGPWVPATIISTVIGGLVLSLGGGGLVTLIQDATKNRNDAAAKAGADASAGVTTKQGALDVITGKK